MTLTDIIKSAIIAAGGDGLANCDIGCGCGLDDLIPCNGPDLDECSIAKSRTLGHNELIETAAGMLVTGDTIYDQIEVTK